MRDDRTSRERATEVSLLPDRVIFFDNNKADRCVMRRDYVADVLAVCEYQQFPVLVGLRLVIPDRQR